MSEKVQEERPSLEDTFAKIESIITKMEEADVTLDESFQLYQQGIAQLATCNALLDEVEKKMQVIGADGSLEEMPF